MKATRKTLKKACDKLFSELVRSRGACERCGKTTSLQTSHIISRTYMGTRFDPDNANALCGGCHLWWHHEPIEAARWLEGKWPGRYDRLNFKRRAISKLDLQLVKLDLTQQLNRSSSGL